MKFANGTEFIIGPLLSKTDEGYRIRFRSDIITPLTDEASVALAHLDSILARTRMAKTNGFLGLGEGSREEEKGRGEMSLNLTADMLPNGSVVLLDNGRWLHARNEVRDPGRHLRRVRWDARLF